MEIILLGVNRNEFYSGNIDHLKGTICIKTIKYGELQRNTLVKNFCRIITYLDN